MKQNRLLRCLFLLTPISAIAADMDALQFKQQSERLKAYVVEVDGSIDPALLPRGTVVRAAIANFARGSGELVGKGLDSSEAVNVQLAFARIDQTAVGMAAITPYLDELCKRLGEGDQDTVALAALWDAANAAENDAHLEAYNSVYASLSPASREAVDRVIEDRNAGTKTSRMRWADAAREVPDVVRLMLENSCKRWTARASPQGPIPDPDLSQGPQSE